MASYLHCPADPDLAPALMAALAWVEDVHGARDLWAEAVPASSPSRTLVGLKVIATGELAPYVELDDLCADLRLALRGLRYEVRGGPHPWLGLRGVDVDCAGLSPADRAAAVAEVDAALMASESEPLSARQARLWVEVRSERARLTRDVAHVAAWLAARHPDYGALSVGTARQMRPGEIACVLVTGLTGLSDPEEQAQLRHEAPLALAALGWTVVGDNGQKGPFVQARDLATMTHHARIGAYARVRDAIQASLTRLLEPR